MYINAILPIATSKQWATTCNILLPEGFIHLGITYHDVG